MPQIRLFGRFWRAAWFWAWAAFLVSALPVAAQDLATLLADRVAIDRDDRLVAEGSVEVLYRGARLTARRIVYDARTDRLTIEGPIWLSDPSGAVLIADAADLSRDLSDGILQGARMVLQDRLQIAAERISRQEGRYTILDRAVASSCEVCPSNPVPLWEVRARRITHDQTERQIYYEGAQLRVAGLPVFWWPWLRTPDPTLDRATGFLSPSIRTTTELGIGIRVPYFITLGDSRDLTVTPYVSSSRTRTLGLRWREARRTGSYTLEGAISRDALVPDETRYYLFGDGTFALPRDFTLDFQIQTASDDAYLLDYGLSDTDLLDSGMTVARTRRDSHVEARLFRFWSLRDGDDNRTLPSIVADAEFMRRFRPALIGGEGQLTLESHLHRRSSQTATDADGDGEIDGRDVARLSIQTDWRRNWLLSNGMILTGGAQARADFYSIAQDVTYPATVTRLTSRAMVELRWPWVRAGGTGATDVLEPVAQLVWAPNDVDDVPNEDGSHATFDEGNLFEYDRFSGTDVLELGTRANLGLSWTRYHPDGWAMGTVVGRVFRAKDLGQFTASSGLSGQSSDWLVSARIDRGSDLSVLGRALIDDSLDIARAELRLMRQKGSYDLSAGYLWLTADTGEDRPTDTSELWLDAGWDVSDGWRASVSGRYDFIANRAARAGFGLQYRTDCILVDLSLSRRYTSSASVTADTSINLGVELTGLGSSGASAKRRACAR
ncbi:LPS-assembly protein [Albidovulum inexpectatum]|uniref:LPS-assembly protein LptD n=1 Tax=Albidovulum inexpectatum TaxID=196587 RepID=A0A2S5JJR9_9RHOB|nr:LPS assembly protein LptD [Albidovulum inexpectatum]PPB81618.1 LPS-assembly protein [Albidovulum inexpectatum]